ncbi:MAG: hypothetical protein HQK93_02505 [Nitrospirae bacterium]|nr:hypothetical protein [Nitrospirota bacterium]
MLNENYIKSLLNEPETGMGYQFVRVTFKDYSKKYGTVYYSTILVFEDEIPSIMSEEILENISESSTDLSDIIEITLIKTTMVEKLLSRYSGHRVTVFNEYLNSPAVMNNDEELVKKEIFKRFHAFKNDRRITSQRGLLPGTYATTEKDANNVLTGEQAVERYALPNPTPAIYLFTIEPVIGTVLKKGIVSANYRRIGGEVEVLFVNGTDNNTVTGPKVIPKK